MGLEVGSERPGGLRLVEDLGPGRGFRGVLGADPVRVFGLSGETRGAAGRDLPAGAGLLAALAGGEDHAAFPWRRTSLGERIQTSGPLEVESALAVAGRLAEALEALETSGRLHGSLQPALVFLEETGNPELAVPPWPGAIPVPPEYVAPELRGRHPPSRASDVYGLGALLYLILTGTDPGPSSGPLPPAPSQVAPTVPVWLDRVVLMALDRDPGHRFPAFATMRSALGAAANALARQRREQGAPRDVLSSRPLAPGLGDGPGPLSPVGRWGLGGIRPRPVERAECGHPEAGASPATWAGPARAEPQKVQDRLGITEAEPDLVAEDRGEEVSVILAEVERAKAGVSYRFSWRRTLTRGLPILLVVGGVFGGLIALVLAVSR